MRLLCLIVTALTAFPVCADSPSTLNVDPKQVTVSGISSGGQMAHQLHIAYSDLFNGAGIIAGGPFNCAEGSLATAMARCMGTSDESYSIEDHTAAIRNSAENGQVAGTDKLADDPVWVFHGTLDTTVAAGLSEQLVALYSQFIPSEQVVYVNNIESIHNFPASGSGGECTVMAPPFVGDCNYDAAGELLQHLYPGLQQPPETSDAELVEVSLDGATAAGLSETAYLYTPPSCKTQEKACALHLVLHGCAQSAVQVGLDFMEQSGYLRWAQANDIILAFPQVVPGATNPYACWDWWGYTDANYPYRDGPQMAVLAHWIQNL